MSTTSLRRDHDLIEKVLNAMKVVAQLLKDGKPVPESILLPTIDFSKNFTLVCHHSKEENSLFPALEKTGMPKNMGPIAVMLMEHEITKEITKKIEISTDKYLKTGDAIQLISNVQEYIDHVSQHLWKENNRLFMMADMRLQGNSPQVDLELRNTEKTKLDEIGKDREYYEKLAEKLSQKSSQ